MWRVRRPRLTDDHGAVAVIVALLMTVLLTLAAVAVDLGSLYAERRQLQNGADAAVLAVVCHRNTIDSMTTTANSFVVANTKDGRGAATVTTTSDNQVHVAAESRNADGTAALPLSFGGAIGIGSAVVGASATASCQYLASATTDLPLAMSRCAFDAQTANSAPSGTQEYTLLLPKDDALGCAGSTSSNPVPGGFGWLTPTGAGCKVTSNIGTELASSPGNTPSCSDSVLALSSYTDIAIPIYDHIGPGGGYVVSGYAAFFMTGYYFAGNYQLNSPCSGSERCIRGYFTTLLDSPNTTFGYSPTAANLGVSRSTLTA